VQAARVIVVRVANWLGDTVMALPALAALRTREPGARITVVGPWAPLLAGQGVADIALPYPRGAGQRFALGRSLRRERPDLAVLLPNSLESALAAWWWHAERRLGFDTDGRSALLTDRVPLPAPRQHQIDEYAALCDAAGAKLGDHPTPAWKPIDHPGRRAEVEAMLAEARVPPGSRIVGLHLGAAFGPSKLWPAERFGSLATRLDRAGFVPLLLGAADDAGTADEVARVAAAPPPRSLVGRDRPQLLPALLARLACLVSGDTGVAHLAAALGVPTVTLFGPTDPRLTAPRGPRADVVYGAVPCSPCFLPVCPIDHVCLREIDVDDVERHVTRVMER
jgi:lipopolysaccharide heptosyltransferase II